MIELIIQVMIGSFIGICIAETTFSLIKKYRSKGIGDIIEVLPPERSDD